MNYGLLHTDFLACITPPPPIRCSVGVTFLCTVKSVWKVPSGPSVHTNLVFGLYISALWKSTCLLTTWIVFRDRYWSSCIEGGLDWQVFCLRHLVFNQGLDRTVRQCYRQGWFAVLESWKCDGKLTSLHQDWKSYGQLWFLHKSWKCARIYGGAFAMHSELLTRSQALW